MPRCPHCDDEGELRWLQPVPTDAGVVLRAMTHPCPAGCGPDWHHPAAESHLVIDAEATADGTDLMSIIRRTVE
ncbi:MAG TPA: hypothetical protein VM677_12775 [Actinokineospora sp.]|jgi:hypothetical protein|nr:hypothetical protein [Actinokineospora sp.]